MRSFWTVRTLSIVAAAVLAFSLNAAFSGGFSQRLLMLAALYVTLSVSLNLINGITGQFSMGHAGFYMVGAYTAALTTFFNPGVANANPIPWLLGMMGLGAITSALAGFVVGVPSLRLRGDYLAIVTLGFGEIVRIVAQNVKFQRGGNEVGGSYGLNVDMKVTAVWVAVGLAMVAIALCRNLLKTARGLTFLAVREDETASLAMGVNVTRTKVTAFVLGSALAGAAGAVLAHFEGFVSPNMFTMDQSFIIVTMVVLGGTGSITGSVVAALLLFLLPEQMRSLPSFPVGSVGAFFIALGVTVALVRWVELGYHREGKWLRYLGALGAGLLLFAALGFAVNLVPAVRAQPLVEGAKLRMVVFAVTLIVLMLLRPQGIFGHREFRWDLFRKRPAVPT